MQQYAVCYRTENKKMKILGPYGGEKVIPGEFIYMQWESPYDTGDSTTVSLSFDDGQSWQVIGVKADSLRTHYFVIPQVSTGKARWMISSGQMEGIHPDYLRFVHLRAISRLMPDVEVEVDIAMVTGQWCCRL